VPVDHARLVLLVIVNPQPYLRPSHNPMLRLDGPAGSRVVQGRREARTQ
jgi:hypothetical protein